MSQLWLEPLREECAVEPALTIPLEKEVSFLALPPKRMVGTARCAVRARKAGAKSTAENMACNNSGGLTAGDAAARRPYHGGKRQEAHEKESSELMAIFVAMINKTKGKVENRNLEN